MPARAAFAETTQAAQTGAERLTGLRPSKRRLGDGGSSLPRGGIRSKYPDLLRGKRMTLRRFCVLVCGVVLVLVAVRRGLAKPGGEEKNPFAAADAQILSEIREHSEAAANLEHLSDSIRARTAGSAQLKQANGGAPGMVAEYGAGDS